jgi:chromate reductase, NAD(P)H dehydrogenase (quinone)
VQILALSGSLRSGSHSSELLRRAAAAAPDDVEVVLYEGLKQIPPYDADDDRPGDQPASVEWLKAALADADAVLVATPEYNHSIPGVLKNALDWVSRPILESPVRNKPAAVLSSSTGMFGGVWAAAETRKVLGALGARVLEETVTVPKAHERLVVEADGELVDELRGVLSALAHEVELRAVPALDRAGV